ncbi:hypothetical protein GJ496_004652 [Pomphorhynchus laevis]|nr:hypothetical protein GJ496_004652 [Pomphorhynchus laevis]
MQTDVLTYTKECDHPIVLKDLFAECGADLKSFENEPSSKRTKLSILHTIPELKLKRYINDTAIIDISIFLLFQSILID